MQRVLAALLVLFAHAAFGAEELRLAYERQSLTATWRTYHQYIDGVEVVGTAVVERVEADGSVHEVSRDVARPAPQRKLLAMSEALASLPAGNVTDRRLVNVNVNGEARPAWRVVVRERPLEPVAHYVDAATGAELRREPLYWTAKARVFDPNPVAKLNDPSLRDQNNAASAVPDRAYTIVDLLDLPSSGMLVGPNVAIVDAEQPYTVHADAAQPLMFDRSQPQFEEVNAYFHLDRAQRYLQSLGFRGARQVVGYAIPVDPHAASGTDNSYYISDGNGRGTLYFGDGGTDDAEDSDIMLHEFGHAIQDWIDPGAFSGDPSAQARAIGEGFGDYWSFSSGYVQTSATGRDPFCIADWDARCFGDDSSQNCSYPSGADCLRRVDSTKTMANYLIADTPGTEHQNGMIWSSALREIFMTLVAQNGADAGRRITDATVIEGTFGIPPNPTFAGMARRLLDADRALWGGSHLATICAAMTKRGILAGSDCGVMPRGELTLFQGAEHGIPIPDNSATGITSTATVFDTRPIDRLQVRVDIEHPSRGDLQIVLVAPDGTSVFLQRPSIDRVADVHATFGFDTEPAESLDRFITHSIAGQWKLVVSDTRAGGAGRLLSWSLVVKFHGDEPRALRPFSFAPRQHIPAVARTGGINGAQWRTDLFLFNRGAQPLTVPIVYTPSFVNGVSTFGAVNAAVGPKQVVAFRNVVGQLFSASGGGTLELQADVSQLVAWSATYDASGNGTTGQAIEAVPSGDAMGAGEASLWINALSDAGAARSNIGIVETAGGTGSADVIIYDPLSRVPLVRQTIPLAPFTHVQFPMPALRDSAAKFAEVKVTNGDARVIAYGSVVGTSSRDAMYVPARRATGAHAVIPAAASTGGANGTTWQTDLWLDNVLPVAEQVFTPQVPLVYFDSALGFPHGITRTGIGSAFLSNFVSMLVSGNSTGQIDINVPPGVLATSFLGSNTGRGDTILPIPVGEAIGNGDAVDAIRIENDEAFRTNFGVTEVAGASALLRITLYDAVGNEVASTLGFVPARGRMQLPLSALTANPVLDGRLHFEVVGGDGRVFAYASVVDNLSADAYFVRAR